MIADCRLQIAGREPGSSLRMLIGALSITDQKSEVRNRGSNRDGFTLLEIIIVLSLMTLILGLSAAFFAQTLPSQRFNAAVRDISVTMKHARALAQIKGERQIFTVDLDSKQYGLEGRGEKQLSQDITIKVLDPLLGEVGRGKYFFVFYTTGTFEGGTIELSNNKKKSRIYLDPIIGSIIVK